MLLNCLQKTSKCFELAQLSKIVQIRLSVLGLRCFGATLFFFNGKILIKKKKKLVSENLFDGTPLLPAYHVLQNRKISSGL